MQDANHPQPDARTIETARQNIQTTREMTGQMTEAAKRLYTLQLETAQQDVSEGTEQMKALMRSAADVSNFMAQWSAMYLARLQRHSQLMRHSLEIAAETMNEVNRLAGNKLSNAAAESGLEATPHDFVERRRTSQIINFPDRRQALRNREQAAGSSTKRRHAA